MVAKKPWELTDDDLENGNPLLVDEISETETEHVDEASFAVDENDPYPGADSALAGDDEGSSPGAEPSSSTPPPGEPVVEQATPAPAPNVNGADGFADEDYDDPEEWDAPVQPERSGGDDSSGYRFEPVQPSVPTGQTFALSSKAAPTISSPSPAVRAPASPSKRSPEERNRDREQIRRTRGGSGQSADARPLTDAREPKRRDRMASSVRSQTPWQRVKATFAGDEQKVEAEREVRRVAVRPTNALVLGNRGKTVLSLTLGMTLASVRGDRVLALDARPSGGSLSGRAPKEGRGTVSSLVTQLSYVGAYKDIREHTAQGPTGLEVLGASTSRVEKRLTSADYAELMDQLRKHYSIVVSAGPGSFLDLESSYQETLVDEADVMILAVDGVDGMDGARKLINTLKHRARKSGDRHLSALLADLVIVVLSRDSRSNVNVSKLVKYFKDEVTEQTVEMPFDPALEGGLEIDFEALRPRTQKAVMAVAAALTSSKGFTGL